MFFDPNRLARKSVHWLKRKIAEVLQHTSYWKSGLTFCSWLEYRAVVQKSFQQLWQRIQQGHERFPHLPLLLQLVINQHCVCGARLLSTEPHQASIPLILRRRPTEQLDAGFVLSQRSQGVPREWKMPSLTGWIPALALATSVGTLQKSGRKRRHSDVQDWACGVCPWMLVESQTFVSSKKKNFQLTLCSCVFCVRWHLSGIIMGGVSNHCKNMLVTSSCLQKRR